MADWEKGRRARYNAFQKMARKSNLAVSTVFCMWSRLPSNKKERHHQAKIMLTESRMRQRMKVSLQAWIVVRTMESLMKMRLLRLSLGEQMSRVSRAMCSWQSSTHTMMQRASLLRIRLTRADARLLRNSASVWYEEHVKLVRLRILSTRIL
jgi:hypothetical protein